MDDDTKKLIPLLRQQIPALMAQDIAGIQPMSYKLGDLFKIKTDRRKFFIVDQTKDKLPGPPDGYVIVDALGEIGRWIEQQPVHMWKYGDVPAYSGAMDRWIISEQLYTLMALKWS